LYYIASGIITPVGGRPVHRLREDSCIDVYAPLVLHKKFRFLLTVHLNIILVIYQFNAQPVHRTATYRCDDTRCCIIQFWPLIMSKECSKDVEEYNKLIINKNLCIKLVNY